MDINYNIRRTQQIRKTSQERDLEIRREREAKRLSDSIKKHFTTTFIGSINAFEKEFDILWGGNLPESELTDNEYRWRKRWDMVRREVLDIGNKERRAAESELREYSVEWDAHHMDVDFRRV